LRPPNFSDKGFVISAEKVAQNANLMALNAKKAGASVMDTPAPFFFFYMKYRIAFAERFGLDSHTYLEDIASDV